MKAPSPKLQASSRKSRDRQRETGQSRAQDSHKTESVDPLVSFTTTPLLFIISAPSGGGKTTLCQQLLATRNDVVRAVTCTTRLPREGEKEGVDYHFLD